MFPRFREQIGTALDLFVEFSTLGEYRLGADAIPGASSAPADAPGQAPQLGGAGVSALRAAVRRTVAGGATGSTPVATPAARRLLIGATTPGIAGAPRKAATPTHKAATAVRTPQLASPARKPSTHCSADRRRPTDAPARSRVRKGAPAVAEQLCLAV